jgi:hypothetical protein
MKAAEFDSHKLIKPVYHRKKANIIKDVDLEEDIPVSQATPEVITSAGGVPIEKGSHAHSHMSRNTELWQAMQRWD